MKKFTTKLLMSIIAVAFAFVALGTSTYAWFSMNTVVKVENMEISAKSTSTYLIIGTASSATDLQSVNATSVDLAPAANESVAVYPSAHRASGDGIDLDGSAVVSNTTTANAVANWYTRVADVPSASASTTDATALTSFTDYVIHKTVYVILAKGSTAATNLVCSKVTVAAKNTATGNSLTIDPVAVLVTSSSAQNECFGAQAGTNALASNVLAATIDDVTPIAIDIWIYYNGADADVFTNNIANLDAATINLEFSVTAAN